MPRLVRFFLALLSVGMLLTAASGAESIPPVPAATPGTPTLFLAGDSTAANGNPAAVGWGKWIGEYFDRDRLIVENRAIGGRSSRTFVTEGRWERLLAELKPGDFVIIQFGHNDGGPVNDASRARGSLPGLGEETEDIDNQVTKQKETVHTYGWYLRKMIAETRDRGAMPILMTLTARRTWQADLNGEGNGKFNQWTRTLAESEGVPLVDLTSLITQRYARMTREEVDALFPADHVHTGEDGARLNAYLALSGLKGLREQRLISALSYAGRSAPTAEPARVFVPPQPPDRSWDRATMRAWLNLPAPADPKLPNLVLIGDSTVRNGRGNGYDGQFGWGDPLQNHLYPAKVNLVNLAVGGTGVRTFRSTYWPDVLPVIKAGDVVLIQFGHNDNGARGALPGVGTETEERTDAATGSTETVQTFGAYLRTYITEIRARGATPVLCTLVPRNRWTEGKLNADGGHAAWTRTIAAELAVPLIDLNARLSARYEALGEEKTTLLFADRTVHTNWDGAVLNAETVVEGLRALPDNPAAAFLRPEVR